MDGGVIFLTADQLKGAWDALLTEPKFFKALYLDPKTLEVKKSADKKTDGGLAPKTVSEREGKKPNGGTPPSFAGVPEFERLSTTLRENNFFTESEFEQRTQFTGPEFRTVKKIFYVHPKVNNAPATNEIKSRAKDLYNWLNEEENATTKEQFKNYYEGLWNEMVNTMTTDAAPPNDIAGDDRGNNARPTPRPRVAQSDDVREELKQIFEDKKVLVNEFTWEQIKKFTVTDFRNKLGSDGLKTLINMFPDGHGIDQNLSREVLKKVVHEYIHSNGNAPAADDDDEPIVNLADKNGRDGDEEKEAKIKKLEILLKLKSDEPVASKVNTSKAKKYIKENGKVKDGYTHGDKLSVGFLLGLAESDFKEGLGSDTVKAIQDKINTTVGQNTITGINAKDELAPQIYSFFQNSGVAPQMPAQSSTTGSTVRKSPRLNQVNDQDADSNGM